MKWFLRLFAGLVAIVIAAAVFNWLVPPRGELRSTTECYYYDKLLIWIACPDTPVGHVVEFVRNLPFLALYSVAFLPYSLTYSLPTLALLLLAAWLLNRRFG